MRHGTEESSLVLVRFLFLEIIVATGDLIAFFLKSLLMFKYIYNWKIIVILEDRGLNGKN